MLRFYRNRNQVFCPVCSSARETPTLSYPLLRAVLLAATFALLAGAVAYLSAFAGAAIWVGACAGLLCFVCVEVYYNLRFRRELECPVCHFDPLLYRRSPEQAKTRCLEGLKSKEQVLASQWQNPRTQREKATEIHG